MALFYPLRGTWLGEEPWLGRTTLARAADGLLYVGPPGTQRIVKSRRVGSEDMGHLDVKVRPNVPRPLRIVH